MSDLLQFLDFTRQLLFVQLQPDRTVRAVPLKKSRPANRKGRVAPAEMIKPLKELTGRAREEAGRE